MLEGPQVIKRKLELAFFYLLLENKNLGHWDSESQTEICMGIGHLGFVQKVDWEMGFKYLYPSPLPQDKTLMLFGKKKQVYLI